MRRLALCILLSLWLGAVLAGVPDRQRQGELIDILQQDCGSCHGMTLKGGLGPSLLPRQLKGKSRAFLIATVRDGRPGTAMPPWGPILSESEIGWLVDQLLAGKGAPK
jgi:cytochrome c55X